MSHTRFLLPFLLWASVATAQPAGPGTLPGTWSYEIPKTALRCINAPEVLGVRITVVIQRKADGQLTFIPADAVVSRGAGVLPPGNVAAPFRDCGLPLQPAREGTALVTGPDTRCGNEGWGTRVAERTVLFGEQGPRIRERGTLYLWTNVCEYEVEAPLTPDITQGEKMAQAFEQAARQYEEERAKAPPPPPAEVKLPEMLILADSALRDVSLALVPGFEKEVDFVRTTFEFGTSQELALKAQAPTPATVLVVAGVDTSDVISSFRIFAADDLVVVVPAAKRKRFNKTTDLLKARRILVADTARMMGRHTAEMLRRLNEEPEERVALLPERLVTTEAEPSAMIQQVLRRKADAAIVYRSAALQAGKTVALIPFPPGVKPFVTYIAGKPYTRTSQLTDSWGWLADRPWAQELIEKHGFRAKNLYRLNAEVWTEKLMKPKPE